MARNLAVTYPNRAAAGTIDYPYGLFRNVTINGDGTGTPLEATWLNDWNGFFQAILIDANIIPNGTTDTGLSSQYLNGIKKSIIKKMALSGNAVFESTSKMADGELLDGTILDDTIIQELYSNGVTVKTQGFYDGTTVGGATYKFLNLADSTSQGYVTGYSRFQIRSLDVYACLVKDSLNTKKFGAKGDNSADDTQFLQHAFDFSFENSLDLEISSGIYLFTSLTIKCPQQAGFYDRTRVKIEGEGVGNSVLQHIGTGTALDLVGENDTISSAYGAVLSNFSIKKNTNSPTDTTNGIRLQRGSGYILEKMSIEGGVNCIYSPDDIWLCKFTNLKLSGTPSYGINMAASGTSNYFDQCYVTFSTVAAYKLSGSYSAIGALAADNCSGDYIYQFNFFSGSANSLGCENADVGTICNLNQSELNVGHLNIFNATINNTKGKPLNCTVSALVCATLTVTDSVSAGDVDQQLYAQTDSSVNIMSLDTNWSFNTQWGNAADNNGFAIFSNKNSPVALRQAGARAYLGLDRQGQGRDTIDDAEVVHSVAIFLDCNGAPRYTSDGTDRRFQVGGRNGDWFIEGDPATNNAAGYVATATSSDMAALASKPIPLELRGITANRPTTGLRAGLCYFDTTLGIPIWYNGASWIDAAGSMV